MKNRSRLSLAVVVAVLSLAAWTGYGQRTKPTSATQKWEYKFVTSSDPLSILPGLNGAGAEGWELVSVTNPKLDAPIVYYFKRPL
jgi:hypothetical protein